ncbi:Uncharacterised protein [Streptococcus pneumoniae]|nr:putative membrane protein [Staphylococcus warneri Lyso 2 2011]KKI60718.1 hypothetical protein UF68_1909 [Staphylococcus warneri]COR17502.1 Uncharacterised protein [Streptococcus pneumoniae]HEK9886278.1 hypothetical protein [Streptococcus equi subsp. equi]COE60403.1 Uncharacterised protein [Staphylococcus warneri]
MSFELALVWVVVEVVGVTGFVEEAVVVDGLVLGSDVDDEGALAVLVDVLDTVFDVWLGGRVVVDVFVDVVDFDGVVVVCCVAFVGLVVDVLDTVAFVIGAFVVVVWFVDVLVIVVLLLWCVDVGALADVGFCV